MQNEKISSGSFDFNDFLGGGYEKDVITMIAGPPGSGKTNLASLGACSQAKQENKVIFIDTEGGFSVERVNQITGNSEKILENILILKPTNFDEQKNCFNQLLKNLKKEQVKLIVIDGMAMLYRLELAENEKQIKKINGEIVKQLRILAEISRKKNIPVLITNQVYSQFVEGEWKNGFEKQMNIVGGDLFKYWSKCVIELKKEDNKRKAVLLKHRSLPEKEMNFEIREKGIFKKKSWL